MEVSDSICREVREEFIISDVWVWFMTVKQQIETSFFFHALPTKLVLSHHSTILSNWKLYILQKRFKNVYLIDGRSVWSAISIDADSLQL